CDALVLLISVAATPMQAQDANNRASYAVSRISHLRLTPLSTQIQKIRLIVSQKQTPGHENQTKARLLPVHHHRAPAFAPGDQPRRCQRRALPLAVLRRHLLLAHFLRPSTACSEQRRQCSRRQWQYSPRG